MKKIVTLSFLTLALFAFTACNEGANKANASQDNANAQKQSQNGAKKCQAGGKCAQGKCGNGKSK